MNIARPVGSEISSVDFGFFKATDIKKLSVKQITNPQILDSFGHPISGGLYDLALGAFLRHPCATCRLDDRFCPGHMGHIELPIPVYNPLFFSQMFNLLRSMCLFCQHFKLKGLEVHRYICKLRLLQHGLVLESNQVDEFHLKSAADAKTTDYDDEAMEIEQDDTATTKGQSKDNVKSERDLIKRREDYVRSAIENALAVGDNDPKSATVTEERRKVIHGFMRLLLSRPKCDNCGVFSPPFRKDGFTKLFAGNLSDRQQMNNRIKGAAHLSVSTYSAKKQTVKDSSIPEIDGEEYPTKSSSASHYVLSTDVRRHLQSLFKNESGILNLIFHFRYSKNNTCSADMFFINYLAVPPTRFRPASKLGDEIHENIQNELLTKILNTNLLIRDLNERVEELSLLKQQTRTEEQALLFSRLMNAFVTIQNDVNVFIDSSKNSQQVAQGRVPPPGIKQTLEKKEGLFRKHMMGKRVNFAARSVISPDPNIETYEIGLPPVFAVKLTYPEPVTPYNAQELRSAVINGPTTWPGATAIQREDGTVISLHSMTLEQRTALANQLQTPTNGSNGVINKKVLRHIRNGDVVIMNRQPTLHKASMMGHRVRVLPGEKTLRLHYANTGAYNADFDGDEMNLHFPQNENARAEAMWLANTDSQYLTPTSGKPLRGLIQDHISTGVWLTNKDTFLTKEQYQQLIYGAIRPEDGFTQSSKIITLPPSIIKPAPMWTGKQVISTILENLKPLDRPGLNLTGKNKIKDDYWGSSSEENTVLFKDGKLLCGVLDKSQFGATDHGMVHAIHEIYGPDTAGRLLGSLGRLFTKYVQSIGFTCGMDDLHLSTEGDRWRRDILDTSNDVGLKAALSTVSLSEDSTDEKNPELLRRLQDVFRDDSKMAVLDMVTQSRVNAVTSSIVSKTIPAGTLKKFPKNSMQEMALSGAKGSNVNVSQIMCLLGQQALEGRRVPVMVSGKSLPSFKAFETNARAGGFITGRFFSGIRPQEYYFHCMAGREGLIDTAVKTSRSGYLQRCLIKPLEGVMTDYDGTVRDSDGTMIQFLYGGDTIDVTRESYLNDFDFCLQNFDSLLSKHNLEGVAENLDTESAASYAKKVRKRRAKESDLPVYARSEKYDPVISKYPSSYCLGSVSETFQDKLESYIDSNELLAKKSEKGKKQSVTGKKFRALMQLKYMQSVIDPSEAVGIIASQSIGEPSTQMTLNTFHFAGHGAANVTLGIPRMREIIMTASSHIKTPQMTLPILDDVTDQQADNFCKSVARVVMSEVVDEVIVEEKSGVDNEEGMPSRTYKIRINFFTHKEFNDEYDINPSDLDNVISSKFLVRLTSVISKEIRKQKKVQSGTTTDASVPEIGKEEKRGPSDIVRPKKAESQGDYNEETDSDKSDSSDNEDNEPSSDEDSSSEDEKEAEAEADKALDGNGQVEEDSDSEMEQDNEKVAEVTKNIRSKQAKEREQEIKGLFPNVTRFDFDFKEGEWCEITLQYPANTKKLLMVNIVEQVCKDVVVREVLRIGRCLRPAAKGGEIRRFTTEGVNFQAMWDQNDFIDVNGITSNDIAEVLKIYGVEAARQTIVNEINNVFATYAIAVSPRHLELIADMMTREGTYLPFNRQGIEANSSPFLKMSFETTCQFLQKAVLDGDTDLLDSPSSRLVIGRVSKIGTGTFDLLNPSPDAIAV